MLRRVKKWGGVVAQRLADLGAALVGPIERLVGAAADKFIKATEQVEHVESLFLQLVRLLFWPLRMVGRVLQAILPAALVRLAAGAADSMRRFLGRAGRLLLQLSETINLDRVVFWLVWLLQPLWRPIAAMGGFVHAWFVTRNWRQMVWGLPALVMLLPFAIVWAHTLWAGNGAVVSRYRVAVKEALEAKAYDRAQIYERKLAQLGVDTKLTEYRTALALAEEGKVDEAYQRMQLMAPADQPGYPEAHFWIVQQLMSGQLVEPGDEARALAKAHLDQLEALEITGPYQQLLQAIWLVQGKQLDEAASVLEPLVSALPNAAFERMRIDLELNRPEQAREDARALVMHMASRTRRGAELSTADYQWWLAAEEVLGNLQQMRTILDQWYALEPDNEQARKALSTVCRRQAVQLLRDPLPNEQQIAKLWLEAAELDNSGESILQLARALYRDRQQTPVYQRVLTALGQSERTPVSLLVAIGTEAAMVQDYQAAREFFALAVGRDEQNAVAWNNYGLVLGEGDAADLDAALVAVNHALELLPKEHRFRETRGQILLRLERWEEAVEDLEFALNGLPDLGAIHRSLAVAYKALGQDDLARLHQMRVE